MPNVDGKKEDTQEIEDEFENDFKKMCSIQWTRKCALYSETDGNKAFILKLWKLQALNVQCVKLSFIPFVS